MVDRNFGNIIWTNHALARLNERGIKQSDAWATWRRPDKSRYLAGKGNWVYDRVCGNQKIEVVAKKNEKGKWLILSVWSRPVWQREKKTESLWSLLLRKVFKKFHMS